MSLRCRIFGHRWSFPRPTDNDIARWVEGSQSLDGLMRQCLRCHQPQRHTVNGRWVDM
jgi:hypothetical protein